MSRVRTWLVLLLLVFVVNLPLVHSTWTDSRVQRSGVDVTATVTDEQVAGSVHRISFTFPEDIDPEQQTWTADVDPDAYADAVSSGEIGVRVLEDDPSAYQVDGAVESNAVLVATLVADAALLMAALLFWRYRGRIRPRRSELMAVALEDVERCAPEVLLERIAGEEYLIQGEVVEIGPDRVVLDLGNRHVVVLLDEHTNPVGYQQPARVRARLIS